MFEIALGVATATVVQLLKRYIPLAANYPKALVVVAIAAVVVITTRLAGSHWILTIVFATACAVAFYEFVIAPIVKAGKQ